MERLNKYIASCGICSRRKADDLILQGRVKINNEVVTNLGAQVNSNDIVKVDNKEINKEEKRCISCLISLKGM